MISLLLFFLLMFNSGNPPGTIRIKNYYVDRTEILNIHWMEYIHFRRMELDSTEWYRLDPHQTNTWYTNPDARYQPIVLISYEQALDYCQWRSRVVSKRLNQSIRYRLPTPDEWREIAEEVYKTDGKNIRKDLAAIKKKASKDSTAYIMYKRQYPGDRVYDLFDNVSEMSAVHGMAMGSNNYDLTDVETNMKPIIYKSIHIYLGFRCVVDAE